MSPIHSRARIGSVLFAILFGILAVPVHGRAGAAEPDPIEIGIFPYYSTRLLLEQYEPMRAFIEKRLERPVYLVTAKDFETFIERTRTHEYPFILTAPHMGRMAQVEDGYRPMLKMKAKLRGVFLVEKDGPLSSIEGLRGRSVGSPDPLAIITMMGREALETAGLKVPGDVRLDSLPTHNAAVLSVLRGENAAALVWVNTMASMDPAVKSRLRIIGSTIELPNIILYMARPEMPPAEAEALRDAILAFASDETGRSFAQRTAYAGIKAVEPDETFDYLDRYLPLIHEVIDSPMER